MFNCAKLCKGVTFVPLPAAELDKRVENHNQSLTLILSEVDMHKGPDGRIDPEWHDSRRCRQLRMNYNNNVRRIHDIDVHGGIRIDEIPAKELQ